MSQLFHFNYNFTELEGCNKGHTPSKKGLVQAPIVGGDDGS